MINHDYTCTCSLLDTTRVYRSGWHAHRHARQMGCGNTGGHRLGIVRASLQRKYSSLLTTFSLSQIALRVWTRCGNTWTYTHSTASFSPWTTYSQRARAIFLFGWTSYAAWTVECIQQSNTKTISHVGWKSSPDRLSKNILTQLDPIAWMLPLSLFDILLANVKHYVYSCIHINDGAHIRQSMLLIVMLTFKHRRKRYSSEHV
jgi:hypothetical protein